MKQLLIVVWMLLYGLTCSVTKGQPSHSPTRIDITRTTAPSFDDPIYHGASDAFVIWNPLKKQWFMYYTQRRSSIPNANGYTWVHGSAIGIATSKDGVKWSYSGTCKGDHDLTEPLLAKGAGTEPGVTWWAPAYIYEGKTLHMFVTLVDGVYAHWGGRRSILHFESGDGVNFKYVNTCHLNSDNVIDPMVYKIKDTWYMVYKNETNDSFTYRAESKDLTNWINPQKVSPDASQEAPFVFYWKNSYWMIVDSQGLKIYKSPNGIDQWESNNKILTQDEVGIRTKDSGKGYHPAIIVQAATDGTEQCILFYFTHQDNLTVIQTAELELDEAGKVICNRNKYARNKPFRK